MLKQQHRLLLAALVSLTFLAACQREDAAKEPVAAASEAKTIDPVVAVPEQSETDRLNAWLDEKYEEALQFSPMSLTMLGRKEQYDQFDEISEQASREQTAWQLKTAEQMKQQFDYDALSNLGKESYDLAAYQAEQAEADLEFMRHSYQFGELGGPESWFATFLINFHRVENIDDMKAYVARIDGVSRGIGQVREMAELSANDGIRAPRFAYDAAIARASNVLSGQPFSGEDDSPLFADAKSKIDALVTAGSIDDDTAEELLSQVLDKLENRFEPAYQGYIDWLEADKMNADEQARGVSALPNGDAYYNRRLATYTTLPMTADEVHQLGLQEVERIKGEMDVIRGAVNFDGDLAAFFEFVRDDPQFYFSNTDEGREEYLADTRQFLAEIDEVLPEYFGTLPKADLVVRRVESFREVDGGAQHYSSASPDGTRPGIYYVHMSDMSAYSKTDMETTAYHEGSPGHHMQISIAQELTEVPVFRTQANFSVYSEGWALYSEKLAGEMGQFKDPYMDFGRLTAEMWRAIRLVVDTGLHTKGWTQAQAEQYFFDNSAIPEGSVRSEVRRYITTPGQATSYKIGMLKIEELRRHAENTLGDRFDIRGFHDVVLGGGALPLPLLETRVNHWIAEQGS